MTYSTFYILSYRRFAYCVRSPGYVPSQFELPFAVPPNKYIDHYAADLRDRMPGWSLSWRRTDHKEYQQYKMRDLAVTWTIDFDMRRGTDCND